MLKARLFAGVAIPVIALATPSLAVAQATVVPTEAQCQADPTIEGCPAAPLTEDQAAAPDTIIVTGSRIARPNLKSAVPIITVSAAELTQRGDLSLGDALSQMPALRNTFTQANSTGQIGTAGINGLDLRGLGTARTLVVVNGRRRVTAQPGVYTVDVNTIPSELLERVDTVTGGNSAVYGSDAIAGVVNFLLKKNYDGVSVRGQTGISSYGDRANQKLALVAGKNFGDGDRFNISGSIEYTKSDPLFYSQRDYLGAYTGPPGFITSQITTAPNRNFDGIPNTAFVSGNPGIMFGSLSTGGYVLTSCPAGTGTRQSAVCTGQLTPTGGRIPYNYAFLPDGSLVRDDPTRGLVDNRGIGGGVLGGLSATGIEDAMLYPGLKRLAGNLFLNGEISDGFKPFVELGYVKIRATQQSTQPTFVSSRLSPVFRTDNPFLTDQARQTLAVITGSAPTFTMARFNNDLGTRAEKHDRETFSAVAGARGDLNSRGTLRYEASLNYGRTENFYKTGGNVLVDNFNKATNAVRNASGQIVCSVNADANPANDDPACVPINLFGYGASSQAAKDYVLYTSKRNQWADMLNGQAFISGDTTGLFELPGGPAGFALGVEYRRERAYSAYDEVTASGKTFLNGSAPFAPPTLNIKEAFAELRLPIFTGRPFFDELTLEGATRISDYGGKTGSVWAYNAGLIWQPVSDLRLRVGYARSVRAPNLSNLYQTAADTYANGLTDPCDQPGGGTNSNNNVAANPNRAANCAAAGIPTTITYTDSSGATITRPWYNQAGSGVLGINSGNPDLKPEVGKSFTVGAVFAPRFLPGFTASVDYYNIEVTNVISGLTGQAILNRCYDDPGGIDNQFCKAIFRRTSADPLTNLTFNGQSSRRLENRNDVVMPLAGNAFINQPYNFAALKTAGIDFDVNYRRALTDETSIALRGLLSYVIKREQYSYISEPSRNNRLHGTLGDPLWQGKLSADFDLGDITVGYGMRFVGKQVVSALGWETFFSHQGRKPTNPDARPFKFYPVQTYHDLRLGFDVSKQYNFYVGVDNVLNQLPPYDATGTGDDAIYPALGRYFYAGVKASF